jgi:hypothetical protein
MTVDLCGIPFHLVDNVDLVGGGLLEPLPLPGRFFPRLRRGKEGS